MILFLILFFALQGFVLLCFALQRGNDPVSQKLSDEEQMNFLSDWNRRQRENA